MRPTGQVVWMTGGGGTEQVRYALRCPGRHAHYDTCMRCVRDECVEWHSERGIPSNGGSTSRRECVPVLCTHRPSLSEMAHGTNTEGCESSVVDEI